MPNANQALVDSAVRHAVFLQRFGGGSARKAIRLLDRADKDLEKRIGARIDKLGPVERQELGRGLATTKRLQDLRADIRSQGQDLRKALRETTAKDIRELADLEVDTAARRLTEAVGFDLEVLRPSPELMRALVIGPLVRKKTLRQWYTKLTNDRFRRIDAAVKLGMVEGDTTPQIIRRLREAGRVSKRNLEALVRTNINAAANQARELLYEANDDVIESVVWISTLDGDTSSVCQARDGLTWPVGEGPRPPALPNCRSDTAPVVRSWDDLSKPGALKPERGADDMNTFFKKRAKELGFSDAEAAKIKLNTRASMNGQISAKETYQSWLKKQPAAFQNETLGIAKAKLFREGVPLDKFVNLETGRPFTIAHLRRTENKAFMRAGLGDSASAAAAA